MRDRLERQQVWIYLGCIVLGVMVALSLSGTEQLAAYVNPALGFMLFVTFLQVPLSDMRQSLCETRFSAALLVSNFLFIPVLVFALAHLSRDDAMLRLGICLVLLAPCIDYVVTFARMGGADARLLLAATPFLLLAQMVFLPACLAMFLGDAAVDLVRAGPFIDAFIWLIALPLALAAMVQFGAARGSRAAGRITHVLESCPVPATAVVLFLVFAATVPVLGKAATYVILALPAYVAFAICAPLIGWGVGRAFGLAAGANRAVAFSAATRNSLVVLPLALAVPGATPVLPAIVLTQTLVELVAELIYVRVIPKLRVATG
ncbi:arsenic resistance protein [Paracoccus sp. (in: a-proteobacteria)]|uniref:arsenic resistance protein n=1 Tax=Paracoccus sp. TaxID=267 RepID=UPI0035AE0888